MSARAKFVFWWDNAGEDGEPVPFFNVASDGSTVSGEKLIKDYKLPLPLFPSYETWKRETQAKRKCFRCWATTRGLADSDRHREVAHREVIKRTGPVFSIWLLVLPLIIALSGCKTVMRAVGVKTPGSNYVDVPVTQALIRDVPASGDVVFHPSSISQSGHVRAFMKNKDVATAAPGGWYEITVTASEQSGSVVEYVAIDFTAQTAHVYNQPNEPKRSILIESVPQGAMDPGVPAASIDVPRSRELY